MGLTISDSVPVITVLLQGFLSFFSPCVLPLLPLYIGYLSGGTLNSSSDEARTFSRKKVLINTLFFVVGISFSFFLLGLGMRAIGRFFSGNQYLFSRLGGVIIILFGLYQLGIFGASSLLMQEKRLPINVSKMAMSPLTALLMGFVFSFAWTPCVGPTLSGVLLMAASAKNSGTGFLLVGIYTIGFVVPFLLTGLFTTSVLNFFKRHRGVVRYTQKVSGALLILMGVLMITGYMNSITGYLSRLSAPQEEASITATAEVTADTGIGSESTDKSAVSDAAPESSVKDTAQQGDTPSDTAEASVAETEAADTQKDRDPKIPAPDFTLTDQYGETHTLSDYKGKIVFLNFWATWCPPCRAEMPDIQALYEENLENADSDLVFLAVAFPGHSGETDPEGIKAFLEENGYTYPTLMDSEASLVSPYYITAFPTTYMIDAEGNIFGYVPGSMTRDIMESIISQTREGVR